MELYNKVNEYNTLLKDGVISADQFQKLKTILYSSIAGDNGADDFDAIDDTINEGIYKEVALLLENKTKESYIEAIPALEYLGNWHDSSFLLQQCKTEIRKIEEEEERIEREHEIIQAEILAAKSVLDTKIIEGTCPKCGTKTNGRFCPECGTQIPDAEKESIGVSVDNMDRVSFKSDEKETSDKLGTTSNIPNASEAIANESKVIEQKNGSKKFFYGIAAALVVIVLIVILASGNGNSSNSSEPTIESYAANDSEAMQEIQEEADAAGLKVSIEGNNVIYKYDIASLEGVTEEIANSDYMKDELTKTLNAEADTFVNLCKQLEDQYQIEGVHIIIDYTYGNEILVTKTFGSSGIINYSNFPHL